MNRGADYILDWELKIRMNQLNGLLCCILLS